MRILQQWKSFIVLLLIIISLLFHFILFYFYSKKTDVVLQNENLKILILQNYVVPPTFHGDHLRIKLRVSLAAARETFVAVVSHGRQLYFYLVRWNTRLVPTVMHPGALCEYQSSHEQRKLFEPKTSVSYWKLKSYVLLLFFFFFFASQI